MGRINGAFAHWRVSFGSFLGGSQKKGTLVGAVDPLNSSSFLCIVRQHSLVGTLRLAVFSGFFSASASCVLTRSHDRLSARHGNGERKEHNKKWASAKAVLPFTSKNTFSPWGGGLGQCLSLG